VIENVDWSLLWIEFDDVSLDVVEAVLVCPAESVSPHELVQITGQLADCDQSTFSITGPFQGHQYYSKRN
jgi:hypothetical protein